MCLAYLLRSERNESYIQRGSAARLAAYLYRLCPVPITSVEDCVEMGFAAQLQALPRGTFLLGAFILWLLYLVALAVYRLYLSPLAKFPGPKLAALTQWYEFYFEVVKSGQFTFHIQDLHKKYGKFMIRRRSCNELYH